MDEIAPNVYVETGYPPVTVGAVLTEAGWVCIDAPPRSREVHAWLLALKTISGKPVRYLINTDYQRDRVLGNGWFGAPVVAHEVTARRMLSLNAAQASQVDGEISPGAGDVLRPASPKLAPPQISFSDSLTLFCGEREIELVSQPSATRGSLWVILREAQVIFAGDTVCRAQHPYISEGVSRRWLEALRLLRTEQYAGWTLVSGREGVVKQSEIEALSEYLRAARRRVADLHRSGGQQSEVAQLVPEFLTFFPYDEDRRDEVQRRVRVGLEAIYEELRASGDEAEVPPAESA